MDPTACGVFPTRESPAQQYAVIRQHAPHRKLAPELDAVVDRGGADDRIRPPVIRACGRGSPEKHMIVGVGRRTAPRAANRLEPGTHRAPSFGTREYAEDATHRA